MTGERREKRSKGHHLTAAEIADLRSRYHRGESIETIAEACNCSFRAVWHNTEDLRTVVPRPKKRSVWETPMRQRQERPQPAAPARSSRFYKSDFTPS